MSEVRSRTSPFLDLYSLGQVPESAIGDFVEAWHASGDAETRELSAFLGMSEDEYAVWVMDGRTLPLLRTARLTHEDLATAVARCLDELRATGDTVNRSAIDALSHWLRRDR